VDEHTLRKYLRGQGALSLLQDDLQKVAEGVTSLAEFQTVGGMGFFAPDDDAQIGTAGQSALIAPRLA
jgi:hypothetical protein